MATHDKGNTSATWIAIQQWFFGWILLPYLLTLICIGIFIQLNFAGGFSRMMSLPRSDLQLFLDQNWNIISIFVLLTDFIGAYISAKFLKMKYEIYDVRYIVNASLSIALIVNIFSKVFDNNNITYTSILSLILASIIFYVTTRFFLSNDK